MGPGSWCCSDQGQPRGRQVQPVPHDRLPSGPCRNRGRTRPPGVQPRWTRRDRASALAGHPQGPGRGLCPHRPLPCRYYFKKVSDEFDCGVVFEEVREDEAVLPVFEEKIIGKVEKVD